MTLVLVMFFLATLFLVLAVKTHKYLWMIAFVALASACYTMAFNQLIEINT